MGGICSIANDGTHHTRNHINALANPTNNTTTPTATTGTTINISHQLHPIHRRRASHSSTHSTARNNSTLTTRQQHRSRRNRRVHSDTPTTTTTTTTTTTNSNRIISRGRQRNHGRSSANDDIPLVATLDDDDNDVDVEDADDDMNGVSSGGDSDDLLNDDIVEIPTLFDMCLDQLCATLTFNPQLISIITHSYTDNVDYMKADDTMERGRAFSSPTIRHRSYNITSKESPVLLPQNMKDSNSPLFHHHSPYHRGIAPPVLRRSSIHGFIATPRNDREDGDTHRGPRGNDNNNNGSRSITESVLHVAASAANYYLASTPAHGAHRSFLPTLTLSSIPGLNVFPALYNSSNTNHTAITSGSYTYIDYTDGNGNGNSTHMNHSSNDDHTNYTGFTSDNDAMNYDSDDDENGNGNVNGNASNDDIKYSDEEKHRMDFSSIDHTTGLPTEIELPDAVLQMIFDRLVHHKWLNLRACKQLSKARLSSINLQSYPNLTDEWLIELLKAIKPTSRSASKYHNNRSMSTSISSPASRYHHRSSISASSSAPISPNKTTTYTNSDTANNRQIFHEINRKRSDTTGSTHHNHSSTLQSIHEIADRSERGNTIGNSSPGHSHHRHNSLLNTPAADKLDVSDDRENADTDSVDNIQKPIAAIHPTFSSSSLTDSPLLQNLTHESSQLDFSNSAISPLYTPIAHGTDSGIASDTSVTTSPAYTPVYQAHRHASLSAASGSASSSAPASSDMKLLAGTPTSVVSLPDNNIPMSIHDGSDCFLDNAILRTFNISYCDQITEASLKPLIYCTSLTTLNLSGCSQISDTLMCRILSRTSSLQHLMMNKCPGITDKTLHAIGENSTLHDHLHTLFLDSTSISDAGLKALHKLTGLHAFSVGWCGYQVASSGLQWLNNNHSLRKLNVAHTGITNISFVRELTSLKVLNISGNRLHDMAMRQLNKCTFKLDELYMSRCKVKELPAGLMHYGLKIFDASFIRSTCSPGKINTVLQLLATSKPQKNDDTFATDVTSPQRSTTEPPSSSTSSKPLPSAASRVSSMPVPSNITGLDRSVSLHFSKPYGHRTGNDNVTAPMLHTLRLESTLLDDRGMKSIGMMRNLTELNISDTDISNEGLSEIGSLSSLRHLNLNGCKITSSALSVFTSLPQITELHMDIPTVTDSGLHHLRHCNELRVLDLFESHISDAGVQYLQAFAYTLEELQICGGRLTNTGLSSIGSICRELRSLNVSQNNNISDSGISSLRSLHHLVHLNLSGTTVSSKGLIHINDMPSLKYLSLFGTKIKATAAKIKDLRAGILIATDDGILTSIEE